MTDNPYKPPPREKDDQTTDFVKGPPPTREARLVVLAILLFSSLIIARLVQSQSLHSLFISSIPIFLLSVVAYYFGLRHGAS